MLMNFKMFKCLYYRGSSSPFCPFSLATKEAKGSAPFSTDPAGKVAGPCLLRSPLAAGGGREFGSALNWCI